MKQAGIGPDAIIGIDNRKLIETHDARGTAEALLGHGGHGAGAVGPIDLEAARKESFGIPLLPHPSSRMRTLAGNTRMESPSDWLTQALPLAT